jgi:hypothetical protein
LHLARLQAAEQRSDLPEKANVGANDREPHERGRSRVAQGSPGVAGTGLLEQGAFGYFWRGKSNKTSYLETKTPLAG